MTILALYEFDVVRTLYRGTTGSQIGASTLILTHNAAVAVSYVNNGDQVMSYEITQYALKTLETSGELPLKIGINGRTGIVSSEYMFQGKSLVEALNTFAK